jgi:D-beta-D-heptose 7-phosphate kinase/D-beta-D-heptose 1-phosphate adenosyltransferase
MLVSAGVKLFLSYHGQTTIKTRFVGPRGHQLLRVDREDTAPKQLDHLPPHVLKEKLSESNIVVVSDYAKGVVTRELLEKLEKSGKRILCDPSPKNMGVYRRFSLLTPNGKEAMEMAGVDDVRKAGEILQKRYESEVVITRGREGMLVFPFGGDVSNIPATPREVYDVSGAGDTVISAFALSLASGASLEEAAIIANHAAGIVIEKVGTSRVWLSELERSLFGGEEKIKTKEELKDILEREKANGRKIVWTNGCFDLIHKGHVTSLEEAKSLGDVLVVGLNSDNSVRRLKGEKRPFVREWDRAKVLSGFGSVDYVVIFPEEGDEIDTAERMLDFLQPHVYAKAGDYSLESMHQGERRVMEKNGGDIRFVRFVERYSTSDMAKRIRGS